MRLTPKRQFLLDLDVGDEVKVVRLLSGRSVVSVNQVADLATDYSSTCTLQIEVAQPEADRLERHRTPLCKCFCRIVENPKQGRIVPVRNQNHLGHETHQFKHSENTCIQGWQ
jgi:hypothetical protein